MYLCMLNALVYAKYTHHFHVFTGARLPTPLANDSSGHHNNSFQHDAQNDLGLMLSISITSTSVLVAITFIIAVVIIAFVRTKYKVQTDPIQNIQNAIYEEIDLMPSVIEYNKNIAYDTAPSVAQ